SSTRRQAAWSRPGRWWQARARLRARLAEDSKHFGSERGAPGALWRKYRSAIPLSELPIFGNWGLLTLAGHTLVGKLALRCVRPGQFRGPAVVHDQVQKKHHNQDASKGHHNGRSRRRI